MVESKTYLENTFLYERSSHRKSVCFWSSSFSLPLWIFPKQLQFVTRILQLFIFLSSFCYCHNLALVTKYMWFQVLYIFMAFAVLCICSIIIVFLKFISFLQFWPEKWAFFFFSRLGLHLLPVLVCTLWDHFLLFLLNGFSHAPLQSFSFSVCLSLVPAFSLYFTLFLLASFSSEDIYFLSIKSIYPKAISNSLTKVKSIPSLPQAKFLVLCSSTPRPKWGLNK